MALPVTGTAVHRHCLLTTAKPTAETITKPHENYGDNLAYASPTLRRKVSPFGLPPRGGGDLIPIPVRGTGLSGRHRQGVPGCLVQTETSSGSSDRSTAQPQSRNSVVVIAPVDMSSSPARRAVQRRGAAEHRPGFLIDANAGARRRPIRRGRNGGRSPTWADVTALRSREAHPRAWELCGSC